MPLYEYKCSKCKTKFEVIQRVVEPPLKKCIQCGGSVTKTISAPAIQFKGSGWYITDYAKKTRAEKETNPKGKEKSEAKKPDAPALKKEDKTSSPPTK
jgi:putative FmdB family regulatory protein